MQRSRDGGELLVGQLAGVIDADRLAVAFDFENGIGLSIRIGKERGVQPLPEGKNSLGRLYGPALASRRKFRFIQQNTMWRQQRQEFIGCSR